MRVTEGFKSVANREMINLLGGPVVAGKIPMLTTRTGLPPFHRGEIPPNIIGRRDAFSQC
jgi:hypothetical protein